MTVLGSRYLLGSLIVTSLSLCGLLLILGIGSLTLASLPLRLRLVVYSGDDFVVGLQARL
jgi:hypothetical protein